MSKLILAFSLLAISRWELLLAAVVLTAGIVPILIKRRAAVALYLIAGVPLSVVWFWVIEDTSGTAASSASLPQAATNAGFVSATACRSCHPGEYASWHRTFHRTMTQKATSAAVVPDWNNVTLKSRGRTYRLFRKGDEFWVDMIDPVAEVRAALHGVELPGQSNLPRVQRRLAMTTGSHHHQTYWVQNDNGTLIQFPWVYHINTKRWVFRIDSFLRPPTDKQTFNVWNISCIKCHSTGGQPQQDRRTRTMHSKGELGISCEACHGAGYDHVRTNRNPLRRARMHMSGDPDPTIVNPARCSAEVINSLCGQCHSVTASRTHRRWLVSGNKFRPGDKTLERTRHIARYSRDPSNFRRFGDAGDNVLDLFWPDGTIRTGGREYHGVMGSPCFQKGEGNRRMSCLSCHSMHDYKSTDDQLSPDRSGNTACTQCHQEPRFNARLALHTHHSAKSSGSRCYNCHMPHTSYALFKGIRSHTIESPDVSNTIRSGKPNACNLCHLDRPLGWTADYLTKWYAAPLVTMSPDERKIAASVLWMLRGGAVQRTVTAWNLGWGPAQEISKRDWMAPFLAELLVDPYSSARYVAYESLRKLPGFEDFSYDFDGTLKKRREARERALHRWRRLSSGKWNSGIDRLLIDSDGRLRRPQVQRILKERDNRPVKLLE